MLKIYNAERLYVQMFREMLNTYEKALSRNTELAVKVFVWRAVCFEYPREEWTSIFYLHRELFIESN